VRVADVEPPPAASPTLLGRQRERGVLHRLLDAVRGGRGGVLVVHGEAGIGKTALLDDAARAASSLRLVRVAGVESEIELAFGALHQLCLPVLDRLPRLPEPQRDALGTALGLRSGPAPDHFLVGLAVLSLLSEAAEDGPLVCLVDDGHWLDGASMRALAFAARRLLAEPVLLVIAARQPGADLRGLPDLAVEGLPDAEARELLASVVRLPLDERVSGRVLGEAHGNPLALLELTRGGSLTEFAGGIGLPDALPVPGRIHDGFRRQIADLPPDTRRLLQLAAADPVGDPARVWRAARHLGVPQQAVTAALEAGLVEFATWVRFRHPLVRSAAYRSASLDERREVHRALAEVTDPAEDPDRRAWHRAQAAPGPDEDVAAELVRSAGRAQARGGMAAAAAFLDRAATLTPDPARRAQRLLDAARAQRDAGALDAALDLLPRPTPDPRTSGAPPRRSTCAGRSPWSSGAPATPPGSCSARPAASNRSTPASPARRTCRRSAPRSGRADRTPTPASCGRPRQPPAPRSRAPPRRPPRTRCSTRSRSASPRATRRPRRRSPAPCSGSARCGPAPTST
jgi:hypothetical protein